MKKIDLTSHTGGYNSNLLHKKISRLQKAPEPWQAPQSFQLNKSNHCRQLEELLESDEIQDVRDPLPVIIDELFDIYCPAQKGERESAAYENYVRDILSKGEDYGNWFYFPWSKELIRYPEKEHLRKLRTSRNKNLITGEEQEKLYEATVAVFGLSVGSNVIDSLLLSGVGGKLIISDMDSITPTNLNRIRGTFSDVDGSKVDWVAKMISKADPYIEQVHIPDGLSAKKLETTVLQYTPDILVDEVDNLGVKIAIRDFAGRQAIPVIMATDAGENVLLDIERYDLEDTTPFLGKFSEDDLSKLKEGNISQQELGLLIANKFVGMENVSERFLDSLQEVGKTLPSWPQLGEAAALSGIAVANATRRVILGEKLPSGRQIISF